MKKILIIAMVALTCASTVDASGLKSTTKVRKQSCWTKARAMYGDMLDCGMNDTKALNYAVDYYWACMDAAAAAPSQSTAPKQVNSLTKE